MNKAEILRVLAVDPGLAATGYAIVDHRHPGNTQLIEGGIIKTQTGPQLEDRLSLIYSGLDEVIHEFSPRVLAIEDLFSDYKNPKTALLMAHARGVCLLAAGQAGIKVYHYSARKVKQSLTGTGAATKVQVQKMVQARLQLKALPRPDHVADAIAVALCHIVHCSGLEGG